MTQDVAGLQFQIDSSQADKGSESLDLLTRRAAAVEAALASMSRGSRESGDGFASFSGAAGRGTAQLVAFSSSLQGVVGQLQAARSAIDGTVASFDSFEKARQRADSLSTALGTSAVSLEAFTRQASVFNLTSFETASALQRITLAIEGQTAAGRQLRALMQDYGVTLSGITASNADQVLTRFVQQVRSVQSSPENTRLAQQVLGPLDPGALASVQNPALETVLAQEQRIRVQSIDRQVTALTDNASQVIARAQRDIGQMRDFEGTAFSRGAFDLNRLSPEQMQEVYNGMGRRASGGSVQDRLDMYRYLNTDAPDSLRTAARNPPSMFDIAGQLRGTWLDRETSQFSNGQYASRQANIQAQAYDQYQRDGSVFGPGGVGGLFAGAGQYDSSNFFSRLMRTVPSRYITNSVGNLFGFDMTQPLVGDDRAVADPVMFERRQNAAAGLADAGFAEPMARVSAAARIRSLQAGSTRNNPSDTLMRLVQAYVDEGGLSRGEANIEATSRYNNQLDLLDLQHNQALSPGAAQMSQLGTERWIMSMPAEQRGRARALLAFGQQQGVSTSRWADRGMSVSDIVGGGNTAAGYLSPNQSRGFDQLRGAQNQNDIAASNDATQTQLQLQRQLVMVVPEGSAAVQQQTAYWNAYNTAIAAGNDGDVAKVKAQNAQREAIATTNTEMEKSLDLLKRRADADERSYAATSQAGMSPVGRAAAGIGAGLENDVIAQRALGMTPAQETGYRTDRQRQLGTAATTFGSDQVASSYQDLVVQQQLAGIAGTRLDTQRQITHQIQTERDFTVALAQAQASGNPDAVATVRQQMTSRNNYLNNTDTANLRATDLNFARDTTLRADTNILYGSLSPADQHNSAGIDDWLSRNGAHPEIAGKNPMQLMDLFQHPERIQDPALRADTQAVQRGTLGTDTRANADATNQSNLSIARAAAAAGAARGGTYASRMASAGVVDPTNPAFGTAAAARSTQETAASFAAQRAASDSDQAKQIDDQKRLAEALGQSAAAYERLKVVIDAENQARAMGPTNIDAQARDNMTLAIRKETVALGEQSLKLSENASLSSARSAAYSQGGTAGGQAFDRTSGTFAQRQLLSRQAASGMASPADIAAQQRVLDAQDAAALNAAYSQSASQFSRDSAARADDNELMLADANTGIFASPQTVNNARNTVLAQRQVTASGGQTSFSDAFQSLSQNDAIKQATDQVTQMRDGLKQMGDAAASGFNTAIVHANSFREVVRNVGETIETGLINTFVTKPAENLFNKAADSAMSGVGNWLTGTMSPAAYNSLPDGVQGPIAAPSDGGGVFTSGGGGSGILGGIGGYVSNGIMGQATKGLWGSLLGSSGMGAAATTPLAADVAGPVASAADAGGSGLLGLFGFATGGVIDRGIPSRYLASGGLIDRPTTFYAAGGTVMAGESDTEAVMPLKRLPNGNLGVAAAGGGGAAPVIMVHAPVTIQGGAGPGGTMSMGQQQQLQKQMEQVHTAAVRNVMANEMRDGGDLSSNIGRN